MCYGQSHEIASGVQDPTHQSSTHAPAQSSPFYRKIRAIILCFSVEVLLTSLMAPPHDCSPTGKKLNSWSLSHSAIVCRTKAPQRLGIRSRNPTYSDYGSQHSSPSPIPILAPPFKPLTLNPAYEKVCPRRLSSLPISKSATECDGVPRPTQKSTCLPRLSPLQDGWTTNHTLRPTKRSLH